MPHRCKSCPGRTFVDPQARDQHVRDSHPTTYECDYCDKVFKTPKARSQHINGRHSYKCAYCSKEFKTPEAHAKHVDDQHSYKCAYCDKVFKTPEARTQHVDDKHSYKCSYCDNVFRTLETRDRHVDNKHSHKCAYCDKVFKTPEASDQHVADKHSHICAHCDREFKTPEARDKHADDKHYIYDCDYCEFAFTTSEERNQHIKDEHFTYECLDCDKKFNSSEARAQHQDAKHPMATCYECDRRFVSTEACDQHRSAVHPSRRRFAISPVLQLTVRSDSRGSEADNSPAQADLPHARDQDSAFSRDETPPPNSPAGPSLFDDLEVEEGGGGKYLTSCPACEGGSDVLVNCAVCKRTQPPVYPQFLDDAETDAVHAEDGQMAAEADEDISVMEMSALEPSARSMRLMSDYGADVEEDAERLRNEVVRCARVTFIDVDDQSTESDSVSSVGEYLDQSMTKASTIASNRCTVGDNLYSSILTDTDTQNHARSRSNSPVPQQHEDMRSRRSRSADSDGASASVAPQGYGEDADQLSSPTPSEYGSVRNLVNIDSDALSDADGGVRSGSPAGQGQSASALVGMDGTMNMVSDVGPLRLDLGSGPSTRWAPASPASDSLCSGSYDDISRSSFPSSPLSTSSVVLITADALPPYARENRPYLVASSGPDGPRSESSTPLLLSPVASSIDMPPSRINRTLMRPVVDDRTEVLSTSEFAPASVVETTLEAPAPSAAGSKLGVHCRMCGRDPCEEITATMCGHLFCKRCITQEVIAHSACPVCKQAVLLYCLFPIDISA